MAAEKAKKDTKEETKEITFKCKFCDTAKPISEMTVMNRYFPLVVACSDCSKKIEMQKNQEVSA